MRESFKKELIEWTKAIVIALCAVFFIKFFLFDIIVISGISMEPTLHEGDRVFVNIIQYKLGEPQRGDIVVFTPSIDKDSYFIKRVIGVPGDRVSIKDGKVYVNGSLLQEDYLPPGTITRPVDHNDEEVPMGTVYVLGDNRNYSTDSRFALLGPVPIKSIKGKASFRVFPFDKINKL